MFCKTITPVIEKETGVIVLGCFPEQEQKWESRYLGLQLPAEIKRYKRTGAICSTGTGKKQSVLNRS